MKKPYRLAVVVGRFQSLHSGHVGMIAKAEELADRVGVFIGSSQEERTARNPFSYAEREEMLRRTLDPAVGIFPLPDMGYGNNGRWGEYVIENVRERFGEAPDLFVTGKEERRISWFDGIPGAAVAELYVPKTIAISGSEMRSLIAAGDFGTWKKYADPRLYPMFEDLRAAVLSSANNKNTSSI